jgi:hypothetical protein
MQKQLAFNLLLLLATVSFVTVAVAQNIVRINIHSSATIRSQFAVFWDESCTQNVYAVSWGSLDPGSNKTVTVYIRNTSPSQAVLYLETRNWSPTEAETQISLGWTLQGSIISPNQTLRADLTLSVLGTVNVSEFTFEIIISAES